MARLHSSTPRAWLALLLVVPLPALAAPQAERAIRAEYRCLGRGAATDVTALFFNQAPAEVVLLVGDTATRLPQALAASGSRYAAGDQEFWIKGDQASWRQGSAAPMACGPLPGPGR
ncbi:MliC family protein [Vulcanococcus limneticus]|uniref:MliC family protein n=1 Tax=Vulcanococcus limneticus TaxID=2170428 RepID=UPI00398BCEDC